VIVVCPSCARRYKLDPSRLGGRTSATVRCPGCGATSTVAVEAAGDQTARLAADAGLVPEPARVAAGEPALPEGMRVTLAVIDGKDSGKMFRVERPSIVIGRGEGDLQLDDPEVSRRHVRLTVHDTKVILHDLGSTNGTFLEETKISEAAIENRAEFRVGATRLMLILSDEQGGTSGGGPDAGGPTADAAGAGAGAEDAT
jgi:DNA segregation ATPase FtsK/SpoIIIE, S-DNA-T family